ncbi:MAG TPA: amidohydrolase [Lachnospiraceae bacterium]|nr:amidohydrolase [Lachnospiraceae bacterium]
MIDFLQKAWDLQQDMAAFREDIHAHPEIGNQERRTADKIRNALNALDIEVIPVLDTGTIGVLQGEEPGGAVAFRSDIDALPIQEETGLPYASCRPGLMHACGHDMHIASLLGAASILAAGRNRLKGRAVFIFQPDEEGDGGAQRILDTGVLDQLGVTAVYGAHVEPTLPVGTIGVRYGSFYANACVFDVVIKGRGCHAAEPEKGTDVVFAAAQMVESLKELNTDWIDGQRCVCSVGSFHAGTVRNILPEEAEFHGILRCTTKAMREDKMIKIRERLTAIADKNKVRAELTIRRGYPGIVNHDKDVRLVEKTAVGLLGKDHVIEEAAGTMTTEDFGFYLEKYQGAYYHVGISSPYPLHSPHMVPDEKALTYAAAVHAAVMEAALEGDNQ